MSRYLKDLAQYEMQEIIQEILDKKDGSNDKQWFDIVKDYDLECSPEVIRKISSGVNFAYKAGMRFGADEHMDKGYVERQKMYDIQRKIRQDMREFSRTNLICEYISEAIKSLPQVAVNKPVRKKKQNKRNLVLGMGDFHYGASFEVTGLQGETVNKYNPNIFLDRMSALLEEIADICEKENPEQVTIMVAGDMLDGLLRTSQLQRLEYGVVESAMKLSEALTCWCVDLENRIEIPISLYMVRGNHGEIRPLGSKAGQFPEENMERIVAHYLYARLKDQEWITISNNDAPLNQIIDIYGYQFLLLHGQDANIESIAKDYVNLYHKPIDVFVVGHLHKSQTFNSGIMPRSNVQVIRVPSLCGIDPYSQKLGYGTLPGATVIIVEEGYGFKCIYPINLI